MTVKFGTDGWRAKIGQDFNFENLQLVTQAFVEYLKEKKLDQLGVAIGYDNRFQSETFAKVVASVCSGAGIKTLLSNAAVTSPVLSFSVNHNELAAGLMITASHNPPEWNGFKIKENFGGSAFPATTKAIEEKLKDKLTINPSNDKIELADFKSDYKKKLASLVDLKLIKSLKHKVGIDPMFGSGSGYFKDLGLPVVEIRNWRDPLFGGINPEPIPANLVESISYAKDNKTTIIVLDGDADRLAAIDESGEFINTHNIYALLLYHLTKHRKIAGSVVKTFNISKLVDKICQKDNLKLHVTPIGFKYVAEIMLREKVILGGEESGGMGLGLDYIPERDGILAGLVLMELMAKEEKTLKQILDQLMTEHGYFYYDRIDLQTDKAKELVKQLTTNPPQEFAGLKVVKTENLDGLKFSFEDESWILFRASGTEPLLRVYVEGRSKDQVKQILGAGEALITSPH